MKIIKYTKREGGEWKFPNEDFTENDILSMPLIKHSTKGYLWGFIHSFIREDGKRFDAYNDAFCIGKKIEAIL